MKKSKKNKKVEYKGVIAPETKQGTPVRETSLQRDARRFGGIYRSNLS